MLSQLSAALRKEREREGEYEQMLFDALTNGIKGVEHIVGISNSFNTNNSSLGSSAKNVIVGKHDEVDDGVASPFALLNTSGALGHEINQMEISKKVGMQRKLGNNVISEMPSRLLGGFQHESNEVGLVQNVQFVEEKSYVQTLDERLENFADHPFYGKQLQHQHHQRGQLYLNALVQKFPDWISARKTRLTASDFATAMEVNWYVSSKSLWEKLTKRVIVSQDSLADNVHLRRGDLGEPLAVDAYSAFRLLRDGVRPHLRETGLWIHHTYSFLGASPDRIIDEENALLEVKCPARAPSNRIPDEHMVQIQGQLEVCGFDFCDYVSYHVSSRAFRVFRVPRSQAYAAWLLRGLQRFWQFVVQDVPPPNRQISVQEIGAAPFVEGVVELKMPGDGLQSAW